MAERRRIVALDFDAVLHADVSGGDDIEPIDDPVPGALRFVRQLQEDGYDVVVFSHRASYSGGPEAIRTWLADHDFPPLKVTDKKPAAVAYVDDKAIRFEGNFDEVLNFIHSDKSESWVDRPDAARILANG